jgi:hypothetical protein
MESSVTASHVHSHQDPNFIYEINHPETTAKAVSSSSSKTMNDEDTRTSSHLQSDSEREDDDEDEEGERVDDNPKPMKRSRVNPSSSSLVDAIDHHIGCPEPSFLGNVDSHPSDQSSNPIIMDQRSRVDTTAAATNHVEFSNFTNFTQFLSKALNEGVHSPIKQAPAKPETSYKSGGLFASVMAAAYK